ncbi:MAG: MarR family transcriptional regulator [Pseudomonadota bacterium]
MFSRAHKYQKLSMTLMRLTRAYHTRLSIIAAKYDLTADQLLVLHALATTNSPLSIGKLSAKSIVQQPAITKMAKQFELRGLITIRPSPSDKRKTLVTITPTGLSLIGEIQNRITRNILPFITGLDEPSRETLASATEQLVKNLSA